MKKGLTLALVLIATSANAADIFRGTFIHYDGGEYESTFVPCRSAAVLSIDDGPLQKKLVAQAKASPNLEIPVSLELEVRPIDKRKYPQSHYTGIAKVLRIMHRKEGEKPCESTK